MLDKTHYRDILILQGHLYSDTYETVPSNQDQIVMKKLQEPVNKHHTNLTKKEQNFITDFECKTSNFYVLPTIHKSKEIITEITSSNQEFIEMLPPLDLKGRPIIAGPVSPTQRLSEIFDTMLSLVSI